MSANKDERYGAKANRDDYTVSSRKLGHELAWKLGENATRKGHCYFWVGTCKHCAGNVHVGSMWSSCTSVIDARHDQCTGPGTAVLTEIEEGRCSELDRGGRRRVRRGRSIPGDSGAVQATAGLRPRRGVRRCGRSGS